MAQKAIKRRETGSPVSKPREPNARIRRIVLHNFQSASSPSPGITVILSSYTLCGISPTVSLAKTSRRHILLKENSFPRESLKTHLSRAAAPLRVGNLKVHSKLFASVYNAIPFVQLHKRNEIICDVEVVILTSRRTLRRAESLPEYLSRIKSFSRAIIARIPNLPATSTRQANNNTIVDLTKFNNSMTIETTVSCI